MATESPPRPESGFARTIGPDAAWRRTALGDYLSEFFGVFVLISLRHRRGRDVRRGPAAVGPRRRHHHRRRLAPHHPWMGDGGHLRHLRRRRHHRRPHQPRGDDRVRDVPRLPVVEGARVHHRPDPGRHRRRRARLLGLPRRDQRVRGERRTADRPRRRRGQHRDIRHRPRRVHRQLRRRVPQRGHRHRLPAHLRVRGRRPHEPAAAGQPRAADHRPRRVRHRHVVRREHRLRDQPRPRPGSADPRGDGGLGRGRLPG